VAVSDELERFAHPLAVLEEAAVAALEAGLARLTADRSARLVVFGLPLNMDGTEGASAAAVRRLAERLRASASIDVDFWDERLSTWEAESLLRETGRRTRDRRRRDQAAACLILQGYLDAHARPR
jgi:putative Holliday junction resolvase